ncbi:hypothetical protein Salat_0655500 [Sesamum alatum]|uniref:Uncharacterized protein n=1 Tax=Sesamum alatum TaxID=300844 RepID=A0AAE1YS07_9LAMI|nr:hypothetical protein Salat_0655500 [Sesamum alatum]
MPPKPSQSALAAVEEAIARLNDLLNEFKLQLSQQLTQQLEDERAVANQRHETLVATMANLQSQISSRPPRLDSQTSTPLNHHPSTSSNNPVLPHLQPTATGTPLCSEVTVTLKDHDFVIPFYVLPIQGADAVLGVQWLSSLGPILADFSIPMMEFYHCGALLRLTGETLLSSANTQQVVRLLDTQAMAQNAQSNSRQMGTSATREATWEEADTLFLDCISDPSIQSQVQSSYYAPSQTQKSPTEPPIQNPSLGLEDKALHWGGSNDMEKEGERARPKQIVKKPS